MTALTVSAPRGRAVTQLQPRSTPQLGIDLPWTLGAVLSSVGFLVVGVALLAAAWVGASQQADPREQVLWLNLAVLAVSVHGAGCALWLLVGRRSVAARSARVYRVLAEALVEQASAAVRGSAADDRAGLVCVVGLRRAHLPTCPLVVGRALEPAPVDRTPCGVCGT